MRTYKRTSSCDYYQMVLLDGIQDNFKNDPDSLYPCCLDTQSSVDYELWDSELHIYYKQLMSKLTGEQKERLLDSQKKWLEMLSSTIGFNSSVILDSQYESDEWKHQRSRAEDEYEHMLPILKERALLLKYWSESINDLTLSMTE